MKKLLLLIFLFATGKTIFAQPAGITDLSALSGPTEGEIKLFWTYPGPDKILAGEKFAIQYSSYVVTWTPSSAQIFISTGPVNPGESQSWVVANLTPGTTYFFRVWTSSYSASVWSDISNGATTFAQYDVTPPAKITTLVASGDAQISLNWITPGDDGTSNGITGGFYHIRYSTNPLSSPENAEKEIFLSTNTTPAVKNYLTISGLLVEVTYYFWIRTSDERNNWSVWSNTATAISGIYVFRQNLIGLNEGAYGDRTLAIVDFNNDGWRDIVASGLDNVSHNRFLVYQNSGSSVTVFAEPLGVDSGLGNGGLAILDYDRDGYPDIAITGYDGTNNRFIIFHNDSGMGFSVSQEPLGANTGLIYGGVVAFDFDNDGDDDLLTYGRLGANPSFIIWRNDSGVFVQYQQPLGTGSGLINSAAAVIDYNNDGWLDIVACGYDGANRRLILFKNSSGTFTVDGEPMGTNSGIEKGSISVGDYNNDGWPDIVACGYDGTNRRLLLFKNSSGTFTLDKEPLGTNSGLDNSAVTFGDYNFDGNLDLFTIGRDSSGNMRFLVFRSSENFQLQLTNEVFGPNQGISYGDIAVADLFGDGDLDIVVQGNSPAVVQKIMESYLTESGRANSQPLAPTLSTVTYDNGDLTIYWTDGSDSDFSNPYGLNYVLRVATTSLDAASNFVVPANLSYPYRQQFFRTGTNNYRILKNISARTTYYWQIKTLDRAGGESSWSVVFSTYLADTTPPERITDLTATYTSLEGEIKLNWTSPNDPPGTSAVKNYLIHYATFSVSDAGGDTDFWWLASIDYPNNIVPKNPGSGEQVIVTGLFPGVTYYFGIKSVDFSDNVSLIDEKSANQQASSFCLDTPPLAPSVLEIISSSGTLTLNWNEISLQDKGLDFDCYLIFRSTVGIDKNFTLLTTTTETVYVDTNLTNGLTYYYRIMSRDLPPNILLSTGSVVNWKRPQGIPLAPQNFLAVVLSTTEICWQWQDVSPDEDGFRLTSDTGGIVAILGENSTNYTETNLFPNTSYYRAIKSYNSQGESEAVFCLAYTLPLPPENLTALDITFNSCKLVWSAPAVNGAFAYKLLRSTDGINYFSLLGWANHYQLLYYLESGLSPATTYYYRLYAYNGDGKESAGFQQLTVITEPVYDTLAPQQPEKIFLEVSGSLLKISWPKATKNSDGTPLTDFAGYSIYFSSYPDIRYRQKISTTSENYYEVLLGPEKFYLVVTVFDQYGNESLPSDTIQVGQQPGVVFFSADYSAQILADEESLNYLSENNEYHQQLRPALERKSAEENSFIQRSYELSFYLKDGTPVSKLSRAVDLRISFSSSSLVYPYWYNGKYWQKISGQKTSSEISLAVKTSGKYQLRYSASSDFAVPAGGVYPKVITPNNDHYNDFLNLIYLPSENSEEVRAFIYNLDGKLIKELKDRGPIINSFIWDGTDKNNQKVSGGIYIYELRCGSKKYRGTVVVAY